MRISKSLSMFISFRCISFITYIRFFFLYIEIIIELFFKSFNRPFFIADVNLFAFELIQRLIFFFWFVYFVFFQLGFCYFFSSGFTKTEQFHALGICSLFFYSHNLSFFINHYDFSTSYSHFFKSSLGFWFERSDFSFFIYQYRGSFTDFNHLLIFRYLIIFRFFSWPKRLYFIFNPTQVFVFSSTTYSYFKPKQNRQVRLLVYIFIYFFFLWRWLL